MKTVWPLCYQHYWQLYDNFMTTHALETQDVRFREIWPYRSSSPGVILRKGVLEICIKFTGEYTCRSAIQIKLLCNFIVITLPHEYSPVILLHIFRARFYMNIYGALLLVIAEGANWFHGITHKRGKFSAIPIIYYGVTVISLQELRPFQPIR